MRGDVNCDKCSVDLGYGWDAERHLTKLIGGYHAVLCVECRNRWGTFTRVGPSTGKTAFDKLLDVECDIDVAMLCYQTSGGKAIPEASSALKPLGKKRQAILDELRLISEKWVADKLPAVTAVTP